MTYWVIKNRITGEIITEDHKLENLTVNHYGEVFRVSEHADIITKEIYLKAIRIDEYSEGV
jgi:hypothetical protein